jgi:hypothetical protein
MAVAVLNKMQMLDEEIAATLAIAKERTYLLERLRIDLAALWRARRPTPSATAAVAAIGRRSRRQVHKGHYLLANCKNLTVIAQTRPNSILLNRKPLSNVLTNRGFFHQLRQQFADGFLDLNLARGLWLRAQS